MSFVCVETCRHTTAMASAWEPLCEMALYGDGADAENSILFLLADRTIVASSSFLRSFFF